MAGLVIFRVVILRQSKHPLGQLLRSLNSPGEQVLLLYTLEKDTSPACETAPRAKLVQIPLTRILIKLYTRSLHDKPMLQIQGIQW
jgi:hypothetical protein